MILKQIQDQLEAFYLLETDHNVEDFLIVAAPTSDGKIGSRLAQEALFLKQTPGAMEIGLYVDPEIVGRLQTCDPYQNLGEQNFNAFCVAAEGVSHFLYLLKNIASGEPVTRLEIELQAEVDKFLLAALLFRRQEEGVPEFLFERLFENFHWEGGLTETEVLRYKEANRLATKFCAHLDRDYIRRGRWRPLVDAARRFYRLNHWSKIRHLTS